MTESAPICELDQRGGTMAGGFGAQGGPKLRTTTIWSSNSPRCEDILRRPKDPLSPMRILPPIKFAVLGFFLLLLPGTTHGQQLDRYGGFLDIKGERTGFFHTERISDRWWLVTPDGHGFFGIGVSHPITSMSEGAITFAYDGSQEEWMRDGIRKMRELGFNSVWSGPYSLERIRFGNIDADLADKVYREARIPYAIHVPLIKHQVELKPGE